MRRRKGSCGNDAADEATNLHRRGGSSGGAKRRKKRGATAGARGEDGLKTMEEHVLDTIFKLRGRRPSPTASFASIGVDSLGAIMFIKLLSDSLSSIRIEPSKIYASGNSPIYTRYNDDVDVENVITHILTRFLSLSLSLSLSHTHTQGVTIRSFSTALCVRVCAEKPGLLEQIGISTHTHTHDEDESDADCEEGGGGLDDEEKGGMFKRRQTEASVLELEDEHEALFEDIMANNRLVLDGLRGLFAFMVLWDHFHNPHTDMSSSFAADTSLFVVLSGFSTALQVREPPAFAYEEEEEEEEVDEDEEERDEGEKEGRVEVSSSTTATTTSTTTAAKAVETGAFVAASSSSSSSAQYHNQQQQQQQQQQPSHLRAARACLLLPRQPFNWKMFLASRALGMCVCVCLCVMLVPCSHGS